MINSEISGILRDISRILEIKGENRFRIRAYERAAQNIDGIPNLENFIKQDRLTDIPGIGIDFSEKIKEYARSGKIKAYEDLKEEIPEGLLDLLNVPSIGPKTARLLYEEKGIKNIRGLERALETGSLKGVYGIKDKTIENIKDGIALLKRGRERMTLAEALTVSGGFLSYLKKIPEVRKITAAGSLRRLKETVRDIDILVVSEKPKAVMEAFAGFKEVKDIIAEGDTKSSVRTRDDVQVDCRVVEGRSFGAALVYFTGSKNFNIKLRQLAIKKGYKINEYGVFKNNRFIVGQTEEEIFRLLGLQYIEPELREDNGEIELAVKGRLPNLINLSDIKGDLHVHSLWSDGNNTIEEMSKAAAALGYQYIAVTDHSQGLKVARGLSISDLKKKKNEIERLNKALNGFRVLYGTEVDIDSEGSLDYPDSVLKEFDIVVAAIHSGFKQGRFQLTKRIISACRNKYVNVIAHPTGRLWGVRDAYDIDLDAVFKAAKDTRTHLEINSFPQRLDLNDLNCRRAKAAGVRISIATDSHESDQLSAMRFGISVARRGWLGKSDVLNTLGLNELREVLKK